jgi:hypothetical protein
MVHNGVDPSTKAALPGRVSVFTTDMSLRTFSTTDSKDRESYNKTTPMDITLSPRNPMFRVMRGEWSLEQLNHFKAFVQTHPNVADFNNPEEYDKLKKAPTGAKANAKFIFEEKANTVESRIKDMEETSLISTLLMSNKGKRDVLASMLFYLGENPAQSLTAGELYVKLMDDTSTLDGKHRKAFLAAYIYGSESNQAISNTIIANKAISAGAISVVNGIYAYGTEKIGGSIDSVVLWLNSNVSARQALARQLGIEDGVSMQNTVENPTANAAPLKKGIPYTEAQYECLENLFIAASVKNPRRIGNSPNATSNECTLPALLQSLNAKLRRAHGVEVSEALVLECSRPGFVRKIMLTELEGHDQKNGGDGDTEA